MARSFKDLVPKTASLRKRLGEVLSGSTVAALGMVPPTSVTAGEPVKPAVDVPTVTIVNRADKAEKLLLRMPSGVSYRMLLHRSHASHASHRSHASHASHYSGSSGGGTTATPRVTTPPTATPPPDATPTDVSPAVLATFEGVIDAINPQARTFTIKTPKNLKYTLSYRDDTTIRSLTGEESRLDEMVERADGKLPLEKGQKVQVTWRTSNGKTIATAVTQQK